jgi:hypothetical protein
MPMFRCTIRDVLWLTVVVAVGAAWWADRVKLQATVKERDLWVHYLASPDGATVLGSTF